MNIYARWGRRRALVALTAVVILAAVAVASLATSSGAQSAEDVEWPTVNGTVDGQRYSPLTQIDASNVKDLKVAWQFRVPKILGAESYPRASGPSASCRFPRDSSRPWPRPPRRRRSGRRC
jgi:hypothetical protein